MILRKTLLAATMMLALPLATRAQPVNGPYAAGAAGVNWLGNVNGVATATTGDALVDLRMEKGLVGLASIGWGFGNGLRAELEGNYRRSRVDRFTIEGIVAQSATGQINASGAMVNALYDIGAVQGWPVQITLGGGVGYAWSRNDRARGGYTTPFSASYTLDDTSGAFAYQLIAGLTLPIRAVPGFALTAEYRYFATAESRVNGLASAAMIDVPFSMKQKNENNAVLFGVRYNFGSASAPLSASLASANGR